MIAFKKEKIIHNKKIMKKRKPFYSWRQYNSVRAKPKTTSNEGKKMNKQDFTQIVNQYGKDILRFCIMTTNSRDAGNDLYQDTMLRLFERIDTLDENQNIKSYALSIAIFLWKNEQRKWARRQRISGSMSYEEMQQNGEEVWNMNEATTEDICIRNEEINFLRMAVQSLPEKYRTVLYLHFSADMTVSQISSTLQIPKGTVKTRMQKAKKLLKKKMEA